jgi:hypothetical protein
LWRGTLARQQNGAARQQSGPREISGYAGHFARSHREIEVCGKIRPGAVTEKPFADLDSVWGKGMLSADQFVQIVYLTL